MLSLESTQLPSPKRTLLLIDPGSALSAVVGYDPTTKIILGKCKIPNEDVFELLRKDTICKHLVIEMAESFGAKVWSQVFETVWWTGRFTEAWVCTGRTYTRIGRRAVKMTLTGSPRAKDGQIRNVLIDRFGGKDVAVGKRSSPGPLFGITADCWQALALGVTYSDQQGW